MKKLIIAGKRFMLVMALFLFCSQTQAQYSQTLFWMHYVPQSGYANVALQPSPHWYLGMPALSSHQLALSNTGFAYRDIISHNHLNERVIDEDKLIGSLSEKNHLNMHFRSEWIAFGFARGPAYLSFSLSDRISGGLTYPEDFASLLLKGNAYFADRNEQANLSGLGVHLNHYRELSAGYTRQWTDYLNAGIRAKLLFGMGNVWFERNEFSLYTDPNTYGIRLASDFLINTSLPFEIGSDENGSNDGDVSPADYILNFGNPGFALDLGAVYKPTRSVTVAASIVDLGFISWKSNTENISAKGSFDFNGIDLNDFLNGSKAFDDLLDSLENELSYRETNNDYRTSLNPSVFIAGSFELIDGHSFGLLSGFHFHDEGMRHQLTLSYNLRFFDLFGASLSYSAIPNNYANLGGGFYFNLKSLQLYMLSDNLLGLMRPHTMQMANFQFGINWVFKQRSRPSPEPVTPRLEDQSGRDQ